MEIINEANEKFKDKQDEVCGFLFDVLREFDAIEKVAYERSEVLRKEKKKRGIPEHQESPEEKEHWDDYKAFYENSYYPPYLNGKSENAQTS